MTDTELAWAAGFFDGEGSINIARDNRSGKTSYYLKVSVSQKDPRPLCLLREWFGGHVSQQYGSSRARNLTLHARQAALFLQATLPYLVVKREQAEIALIFQTRRGKPGGRSRTVEEIALDELDREALLRIRQVMKEAHT